MESTSAWLGAVVKLLVPEIRLLMVVPLIPVQTSRVIHVPAQEMGVAVTVKYELHKQNKRASPVGNWRS